MDGQNCFQDSRQALRIAKTRALENIDNLFTYWAQGFGQRNVLQRPPVDER
jgi:hypothetical protein